MPFTLGRIAFGFMPDRDVATINRALSELERFLNGFEVTSPLGMQDWKVWIDQDPECIWAVITASDGTGKYAWEQVFATCEGKWIMNTNSLRGSLTAFPAYEVNGIVNVPVGTLVYLCKGATECAAKATTTSTTSTTTTTAVPRCSTTTSTTTTTTTTTAGPTTTSTTSTTTTTIAPRDWRFSYCCGNRAGVINSTTTTSLPPACTGSCTYTWASATQKWTLTCSDCVGDCVCGTPQCCGTANGNTMKVPCQRVSQSPMCCSTTTSTSTTTTSSTTTTTTTTTTTQPPNCSTCSYRWDPSGPGSFNGWIRTINNCLGNCYCPPPTGTGTFCSVLTLPCAVTTTTTPVPYVCNGNCSWWWNTDASLWVYLGSDSSNCSPSQGIYGCYCSPPTSNGTACAIVTTPCLLPTTTTSPQPFTTTTASPTTTTTTTCRPNTTPPPSSCAGTCQFRGDGSGGWTLFFSTCDPNACVCPEPLTTSGATTEEACTPCSGGVGPTTSTTTTTPPCPGNCLWVCNTNTGITPQWQLYLNTCPNCFCYPPTSQCVAGGQNRVASTSCYQYQISVAGTTTTSTTTTGFPGPLCGFCTYHCHNGVWVGSNACTGGCVCFSYTGKVCSTEGGFISTLCYSGTTPAPCSGQCIYEWQSSGANYLWGAISNTCSGTSCGCSYPNYSGNYVGCRVSVGCGSTATSSTTTTPSSCFGGCRYTWNGSSWIIGYGTCSDSCSCSPPSGPGSFVGQTTDVLCM